MSKRKTYTGPVTGKTYRLAEGERIDPVAEGIGCPGEKKSPYATVGNKEVFSRIFVRLKTPVETLMCRPVRDGADFAQRASIIENWFNSVVRKPNMILTFEAMEITEEEAMQMEEGGEL